MGSSLIFPESYTILKIVCDLWEYFRLLILMLTNHIFQKWKVQTWSWIIHKPCMEIPEKILFKKHYANFHIAQASFTFYQDKIYVLIKSMI